jgi:ABC-type uncharacterized transport system substrate-binding protein
LRFVSPPTRKETVAKIRRVAALLNPANPVSLLIFKETDVAPRAPGLQLQSLEARGANELPNAFEVATKERADAPLVIEDLVLCGDHGDCNSAAHKASADDGNSL